MLNKLQLNSLVTSLLLLPALALTAHPSDFSFDNLINYPTDKFSIFSNHLENYKEGISAEKTLLAN